MSLNLDLLDSLFDVREKLTGLVVQVSPGNDEEATYLKQLIQVRDRVNGAINRIIALNVGDAVAGLEDALQQIQGADKKMATVTNDIAGVKTAITIVGQVLTVAATVIATAAAL